MVYANLVMSGADKHAFVDELLMAKAASSKCALHNNFSLLRPVTYRAASIK